jgi:hypothetical protein
MRAAGQRAPSLNILALSVQGVVLASVWASLRSPSTLKIASMIGTLKFFSS